MTVVNEETKQEVGTEGGKYEAGSIVKGDGSDVEVADPKNDTQGDDRGGDEIEVADGDKNSSELELLVSAEAPWIERYIEVLKAFWPLGLIAFGGPTAHFAILKDHLVDRRGWMDEEQFLELFAIGQGLPGPTSTQLVVSTALSRAGPIAGVSALLLWNLPGLVILTTCGVLLKAYVDPDNPPFWLAGLPPAAISLVFKAFYDLTKKFDKLELSLCLFSHLIAILINGDERIPSSSSQYVYPLTLILGALITFIDSRRAKPFSTYNSPSKGWDAQTDTTMKRIGIPLWVGGMLFAIWAIALIAVFTIPEASDVYLSMFQLMFRVGSIIFGGGQVVIPLLQDDVVPQWMTKDQFLQGLGLAQSMPGPLFNFAAYLGAIYQGVPGALVSFVGIFAPGVILIFASTPFWARMRHVRWFKAALKGLSATSIGLVGAACIILWEAAITTTADAMVFSVAAFAAGVFNLGAPFVVLLGGVLGAILHQDAASLGQVSYCVKNGFVEA